ncbi:hypothetical protein [Thalassolituus marinus]|uniref:Transposase DDE domain-containing protein n=1 Tax=Thalassolituus marinus TaxID=671053 RepID=A0ABS7ZV00_9GAMM|nr:hypothetical protein [Thalassolituus marinus]MCA6065412.1 hypothetical protein [Thalassolituus marinus]
MRWFLTMQRLFGAIKQFTMGMVLHGRRQRVFTESGAMKLCVRVLLHI